MEEKNKYVYSYKSLSIDEQREIRNIKNRYATGEEDIKKQKLQKLDSRVTNVPLIISISLGIIGILVFGFGMSLILVWEKWVFGVLCIIFGLAIMIPVYWIHLKIYNYLKLKYKDEILKLADEILNEQR